MVDTTNPDQERELEDEGVESMDKEDSPNVEALADDINPHCRSVMVTGPRNAPPKSLHEVKPLPPPYFQNFS